MIWKSYGLGIAVLLYFGLSAFAGTASMTLTSPGNDIMGSVYVNPYIATINGVSNQVICDDFVDDTYLNESWTATTHKFSDLGATMNTSVKWNSSTDSAITTAAQQLQLYDEAAWLTLQLLSAPNPTVQGEISYAIWGVFDPPAVSSWLKSFSTAYANAAQGWINTAAAQTYTPGEFSNFTIYTPAASPAPTCSGHPCSTPGLPQEFLVVTMSEPPLPVLLGLNLMAVLALIFLLRRRLARPF